MSKQIDALKLALEALETSRPINQNSVLPHNKHVAAITAIKEALAQPDQFRDATKMVEHKSNEQVDEQTVTVLPDGSAFAIVSYPLPKTHWIYAEREYADGEDEPLELGKPILTHEVRDAVISAVRYAVRGATMCGKESDFDPDALVQNAVYALCGPYTAITHPPVPTGQPKEPNKDGSPCPEFWDWLPKAYNFEGDGNFTKYNMEVAFLAGKQAAQPKEPEQEPVAFPRNVQEYDEDWIIDPAFISRVKHSIDPETPYEFTPSEEQIETTLLALEVIPASLYTNPPQRTWAWLTDEEIRKTCVNIHGGYEQARAIEAILKEKNT